MEILSFAQIMPEMHTNV